MFGFKLTQTSALLLFMFSALLIVLGVSGILIEIEYFYDDGYMSASLVGMYLLMITIGTYVLIKTLLFRKL